jgi:hypothetical protein
MQQSLSDREFAYRIVGAMVIYHLLLIITTGKFYPEVLTNPKSNWIIPVIMTVQAVIAYGANKAICQAIRGNRLLLAWSLSLLLGVGVYCALYIPKVIDFIR